MAEHVSLSPDDLGLSGMYELMAAAIAPRPIALVSTVSFEGRRNLAPFSFFMPGGSNPPSLAFSPTLDLKGRPKDTLSNIEATRVFTVNLVDRSMARAMNAAAARFPSEVDEWDVGELTALPGQAVSCPRVAQSPAAFECRLFQIVAHGEGPGSSRYVVGEIVQAYLRRDLWDNGRIDRGRLRLIGRLGGAEYVDLATPEIFELPRPSAPPSSSG